MGPRQADLVLDLLRESARVVIAETSAAGGAIGRFQPSRIPGDLVDQHQQGGQIGRIGELAQLGEAQVRWCAGHGLRPPSWLLGPAITCRYRRTRAITRSRAPTSDGPNGIASAWRRDHLHSGRRYVPSIGTPSTLVNICVELLLAGQAAVSYVSVETKAGNV